MKKRFSGPQIVAKLRQADILIGQGISVRRSLSIQTQRRKYRQGNHRTAV